MECSKLVLVGVVGFIYCFCMPTMEASINSSEAQFRLRVNLTRRSEGLGFNSTERLRLAVDRSKKRMNALEAFVRQRISGQLDVQSPVEVGNGEFLMSVGAGTPSVSFKAIVDTGSDLIWTQCKPCQKCFSQPTPIFDPSQSSSYSSLSCTDTLCEALDSSKTECDPNCTFSYSYGDRSRTIGDLAKESFSVGDTVFADVAFGCGHDNQGKGFSNEVAGLVGLGRGPLSLISQLGSKVDNKFSYCLLPITDSSSQTSPLIFGDSTAASLNGAKTVSFIKSSIIPTFWYIPVTGITINGKAVDIPTGTFDLQSDGSGGMIIDSGTTLTYLLEAAYNPVKEAIQAVIDAVPTDGSSIGMDLCYGTSSDVSLPTVSFNFEGGVDYELPAENLFRRSGSLLCLAMDKSSGVSILGNVQQQNFHIVYDNAHNTLSFLPTACDSL